MVKRKGRKTTETSPGGVKPLELAREPINTSVEGEFPEEETLEDELELEVVLERGENSGYLEEVKEGKQAEEVNKGAQTRKSWSDLFNHNREGQNGLKLQKIEEAGEEVVITREDVEPEVRYWEFSLIAYIISQNIPVHVMVNFLRYRWKGLVLPQVVKHEDVYFILRFENQEEMEAALARGTQFFYSKPMIVRRWMEGSLRPEELNVVPVWIQLPKLPLGYWGVNSLSKIVTKIGEPVKTDELTARKMKIEYARVLVNVEVGRELPEQVQIKSEVDGTKFVQLVKYEWLPIFCKKCKRWGHKEGVCQKTVHKQWQVKPQVQEGNQIKENVNQVKPQVQEVTQVIIGKERVVLPAQGSGVTNQASGSKKGKEKATDWIEVRGKGRKGNRSDSEDVINNLFHFLSQTKEIEEEVPPKPPNI